MQRSFWSNWFKPTTASSRKWTLEELGELYDVLLRNGVVTEQNRAVVVETIRTIAEYILWGDQNEPRIFDFFLENNILTYLHKVLLQPSNRSGEVAKQVLQTLSIIIQNVRSETGIFFLFSNNHINNIVDLDFDFSDEEVLGYYISFLKTISLKVNAGTVHFFLNSSSTGRGFPLYTRAIRLAHNREGMVRAAVRTLTLNVYSVPDPDIISFVTSPPAAHYFAEVAHYLAEQVQLLDRHLVSSECGGAQALGSLDSQLAETEDVLSYVSDLLSLGVAGISQLLASSVWQWVVRPLLLRPLMQAGADQQLATAAGGSAPSLVQRSSGGRGLAAGTPVGSKKPASTGHLRHWSWGSGSWGPDAGRQPGSGKVRPVCAVFVLERMFLLISYQPLLQQLLLALTCSSTQPPPAATASTSSSSRSSAAHPLEDYSNGSHSQADRASSSSSCRACLLGTLASDQPFAALLVLRLMVAIVNSKHLQPELLSALSLLPRKHQETGGSSSGIACSSSSLQALTQLLVQQLQEGSGTAAGGAAVADPAGNLANSLSGQGSVQADLVLLLMEQYLSKEQHGSTAAAVGAVGSTNSDGSGDAGDSSTRATQHLLTLDCWTTQQQPAAGSSCTFAGFGQQLLSSLVPLLQLPGLPPLGLWLLGWLLHQLLPVSAVIGATAAGNGSSLCANTAAVAAGAAGADGRQRSSQSLGGTAEDNLVWEGGSSSRQLSRTDSESSSGSPSEGSVGRHERNTSSIGGSGPRYQQGSSAADSGLEPSPGPPLSTTRAISVQSSLGGPEPRASVLTPEQQHLLQGALDAAHAAFAQQLGSMWCEAVFPLLALEWPAARDMMLRPVLRASSSDLLSGCGVWPVLRALQQQQQQRGQQQGRQLQQQGSWCEGHSESAQAALESYLAVQRVVALTQIQELLRVGCVAFTPPVPTVSESDLKQVDIQEGYQVDLAPGSALPCVVSFAPGQERRVFFAVAGLSRQQMVALQGPPSSLDAADPSSTPAHSRSSRSLAGAAGSTSSHHASLLRSLPVAVLADPSPSRPQAGVVLSVAPLLGARPYTDPQVGRWLHVHVRPSVRGLLRIIKTAPAKKGGVLSAMRQLADGHWVLAFSAEEKASLAVALVQQHATRLQGLYGDALAPMCSTLQDREQQLGEPEDEAQRHEQQQQLQAVQQQQVEVQQQQADTVEQWQQSSSQEQAQPALSQQEDIQQQLQVQLQQEPQHAVQPPGLLNPAPPEAIDLAAPPAVAAAASAARESAALDVTAQQQQQQQADSMGGQPAAQNLTDSMAHIRLADTGEQPG